MLTMPRASTIRPLMYARLFWFGQTHPVLGDHASMVSVQHFLQLVYHAEQCGPLIKLSFTRVDLMNLVICKTIVAFTFDL